MSNTRLAKTAVLLALGLSLSACSSSDERSLVLLNIRLAPGAPPPERVLVSAANQSGGEVRAPANVPWTNQASSVLEVGLFIPEGVAGPVLIGAQGVRNGLAVLQGVVEQQVALKLGGSVGPLDLVLNPTVVPPVNYDGGVDAVGIEAGHGPETSGIDGSPDRGPSEAGPSEAGPADVVPRVDVTPDAALPDANVSDLPLASDGIDANPIQPDVPLLPDGPPPTTDTTTAVDVPHVRGWEPAKNVEKDPINSSHYPALVVEPISENVYLAWNEDTTVKARRWNRATDTWEKIAVVESRGEPRDIAIGADAKGNVHVVWCQYLRDTASASLAGTWTSRTTDGVSWSSPVRIGALPTVNANLAVARNGTARVMYEKESFTPSQTWSIYSAYFDGTAWTENPTAIEPTTSNMSRYLHLVGSETGDGIAIFNSAQDTMRVAAVTFTGQSVTAPYPVNPGDVDAYYSDRTIAMNRKGEAVFVWGGGTTSNTGLYAKSYSPKTGWGSASPAITTSDGLYEMAAALDEAGNVTIVWQQGTMTGTNMMGIHGSVSGSWGDINLLENDNKATYLMDHYGRPQMAIDGNGDVLVVWRKDQTTSDKDYTYGAYASGFVGGKWLPQFKLGQIPTLDIPWFSLSVSDKGLGAVTYVYISGPDTTTSEPDAYNAMVAFYR